MARLIVVALVLFVWWRYGTPHVMTTYECRTASNGHTCLTYFRCTYWGLGGYTDYRPLVGHDDPHCPGIKFF